MVMAFRIRADEYYTIRFHENQGIKKTPQGCFAKKTGGWQARQLLHLSGPKPLSYHRRVVAAKITTSTAHAFIVVLL
jgi:hypothetical protein